jgi:predicted nucleotide-binding protein
MKSKNIKRFSTTTRQGLEGCNISYSSEKLFAECLLKKIPKEWEVNIRWVQILFSDVNYIVDKDTKTVFVQYNQNLHYWQNALIKEVVNIIKEK